MYAHTSAEMAMRTIHHDPMSMNQHGYPVRPDFHLSHYSSDNALSTNLSDLSDLSALSASPMRHNSITGNVPHTFDATMPTQHTADGYNFPLSTFDQDIAHDDVHAGPTIHRVCHSTALSLLQSIRTFQERSSGSRALLGRLQIIKSSTRCLSQLEICHACREINPTAMLLTISCESLTSIAAEVGHLLEHLRLAAAGSPGSSQAALQTLSREFEQLGGAYALDEVGEYGAMLAALAREHALALRRSVQELSGAARRGGLARQAETLAALERRVLELEDGFARSWSE